MKKKRSITKLFLTMLLIIAYLPIVILGIIAIQKHYSDFNKESIKLRKEYMEAQEAIVKKEVEMAIEYIEWKRANSKLSEEELQKEILEWLSKIRFQNRGNEEGILFVRSYKGIHLMSSSTPQLIGKDLSKMIDPEGVNNHDLYMRTIQNPEGGYAEYSWYNPAEKQVGRKKSFVKGFPEWQWCIGAGFWFDDINSVIEQKRLEMQGNVKNYVMVIGITMLILFIISYINLRFLSRKIEKGFESFTSFFVKASTQSAKIDPKEMQFSEFEKLAITANKMIEEREQIEAALQETEIRYRKIFDESPDALFILDNTGHLLDFNKVAGQRYGYSREELMNMTATDLASPELKEQVALQIKRALETGLTFEWQQVCKDGRRIDVEISTKPIVFGEQKRILANVRDITKRKQVEKALKQHEAIVESSKDMMALLDSKYRYIDCNNAYLNAFSMTSEDLLGHSVSDIFGDEFFENVIKPHAEICLSGEFVKYEDWFDFPVSGRKYMSVSYSPYMEDGSQVKGFIVSARDITERKQAEESLRKSEERYRLLFDSMSEGFALHEIITDEQGKPCDFRFLEMNPACERLTGMNRKEMIGHRVREITTEPPWIEHYGKVALTGESVHFQDYSTTLKRWFEVFAYQPKSGQCAVVFTDITDRKKAEEELKKKMHDLEIFNDAAVGRELMINELRKEINELLAKLGKEPKYKIIT